MAAIEHRTGSGAQRELLGWIDPACVAEDAPMPDLFVFYLGEPCGGYCPTLGEDDIVCAPSSFRIAEEPYPVCFCEALLNVDLVAGKSVEEVLPSKLHLVGAGEAVSSRVGEGVILCHQHAQRIRIGRID